MDFANTNLKDLACFVYGVLKDNEINAILVGGACVSIYTQNRYQSYDLDFVTYEDLKLIEKVLARYEFKRTGRCFKHDDCPYLIDFVAPPIAIGHEPIRNFKMLKTHSSSLQLLTPTDCIKDRLSHFFTGTMSKPLNKPFWWQRIVSLILVILSDGQKLKAVKISLSGF